MIPKWLLISAGILIFLGAATWYGLLTPTKDIEEDINNTSKPTVFLIVDSLMDEPMLQAIKEGKAPALKFLMEQGDYIPEVVSSYPTMSVTIDSTLLTGSYADGHQLPGLVWFHPEEQRLVNYGAGKMEVLQQGIKQVVQDGVYNLNEKHLSNEMTTIYEELYDIGLSSASINGLVYRGKESHQLHIPGLATAFNLLPDTLQVKGPSILSMGIVSRLNPENVKNNNPWQGLGVNDTFTAEEVRFLIENNSLPSFTLAYLPDLDHYLHEEGPEDLKGIEAADKQIQRILNAYPTWEAALEEISLIVYGDSGQSFIGKEKNEAVIDLTELGEEFQVAEAGKEVQQEDQVILGVNERMAYIYLLDESITYEKIAFFLRKDPRIGFIAWKDDRGNHVFAGKSQEKLIFQQDGTFSDKYGQNWDIKGNPAALDLSIADTGDIEYGDYPDALARLYGALHSHRGRFLIVDAMPGYEFVAEHSPTHLGGAGHGSLHKKDSVTPLIVTGIHTKPRYPRVVDFKQWLLEEVGQ
ncbi:alkaline phosphatase family protein [Virgibacillus sediminis]|uniref:Alkaline phosphatase family protein n=1 Tax=Virgibacillus sediminis TaxID=202260 RepID=A0ABV7AAD7_9BACI